MESILEYQHATGENVAVMVNDHDRDMEGINIIWIDELWLIVVPGGMNDYAKDNGIHDKMLHAVKVLAGVNIEDALKDS